MKFNPQAAQSVLEYAFVLVVVVAALLSMQIYAQRAMQGRLRQYSEELGEQYAPGQTKADISSTLSLSTGETTNITRTPDTESTRDTKSTSNTIETTENTTRTINQTVVRQ